VIKLKISMFSKFKKVMKEDLTLMCKSLLIMKRRKKVERNLSRRKNKSLQQRKLKVFSIE
jgi:hypothetical protein